MDTQKIKPILKIIGLYVIVIFFIYFIGKYASYLAYYVFADPLDRNAGYKLYAYIIMSIALCIILCLSKVKLKDAIRFSKFDLRFVIKLIFIQLTIPFILNINSAKDINLLFNSIKFWVEALQGKKLIIYQTVFRPQIDLNFLMLVYTIIIDPVIEEIFYKHVIYNKLKTLVSIKLAIFITGILFLFAHIPYYELRIDIISLLMLGVLTTYCYEKTNTVWVSIIIHSVYNAYVTFISIFKINFRILIYLTFFIGTIIILIIELIKYLKRRKALSGVQGNTVPDVKW